ncbi:hypothetical protein LINGRAHAP2_LOCUS21070 [Linum grandiflorum]
MLLTDLSAGEPPAKLQLRLQHLWRLCNPVEPDKYFALGTAWTDAEEHRIEGYTEPGQAEAVRDLLIPGLIYKIQNPFLVPARQVLRSCPGDFALAIRPADLLTKISENVPRPFFPLQSFSIPTMPSMRAINQPRTTSLGLLYTNNFLNKLLL